MSNTIYTQSASTIWRFQCDPSVDGTCVVQAFFRSTLVNDEDPTDTITKDDGSVTFTLSVPLAAGITAVAHETAADEKAKVIAAKIAAAEAAQVPEVEK